jgi:hypothetical protein
MARKGTGKKKGAKLPVKRDPRDLGGMIHLRDRDVPLLRALDWQITKFRTLDPGVAAEHMMRVTKAVCPRIELMCSGKSEQANIVGVQAGCKVMAMAAQVDAAVIPKVLEAYATCEVAAQQADALRRQTASEDHVGRGLSPNELTEVFAELTPAVRTMIAEALAEREAGNDSGAEVDHAGETDAGEDRA